MLETAVKKLSLLEKGLRRASVTLSEPCILGSTLKVNPEERLSITELVNQLQEIAAARNVNPKSPITEVKGSYERVLLIRSYYLSDVSLEMSEQALHFSVFTLHTTFFCN